MKLYNIYEILNLLIIRILMIRNMFNFNIIIIDNNNRIKKMNKKQKKGTCLNVCQWVSSIQFKIMNGIIIDIHSAILRDEWTNYRCSART